MLLVRHVITESKTVDAQSVTLHCRPGGRSKNIWWGGAGSVSCKAASDLKACLDYSYHHVRSLFPAKLS